MQLASWQAEFVSEKENPCMQLHPLVPQKETWQIGLHKQVRKKSTACRFLHTLPLFRQNYEKSETKSFNQ
jgi:hypothetical protein